MGSAHASPVPQNSQAAAPAGLRTSQGPGSAHRLAPAGILALQRSSGNTAVARLVAEHGTQPRLQRCGADSACGCARKDADEENAERRHLDAGARLLREAVARKADSSVAPGCAPRQLVQRIGWKDAPLLGKTLWCQWEMGKIYGLRAECFKEFKEVCSGDMLDPACTNFCRRPLLKRDERSWWERWFGLAPDPNRVVPMAEPGSSGDISGCLLDCMKSKDPEAMATFLEVCSGNAASAMGD